MFEKGKVKPEIIKEDGSAETIVGQSVKLKGNLKSEGNILIDGIVTGEVKTKGSVVIGQNANIIAGIKAKNVTVSGSVQGNIEAADRLEITDSGKVIGDVSANVLSIAAGAVFSGKSQMNDHSHKEIEFEPVAEVAEPEEEAVK